MSEGTNGGKLSSSEKDRKKLSPVVYVAVAVAVIAVILLVKNVFFGSTTLNPTDYVEFHVDGLDGEGNARLIFDYEKLYEDVEGKKTLTQREQEEILELIPNAEKDFSLSKSTGLSNGDQVKIESNLETKALKRYRIVFENSSVTETVEGLTEVQTIDVTEYVTVESWGFDGDGYCRTDIDRESLRSQAAQAIRRADDSAEAEEFIAQKLDGYLYDMYMEPYYFDGLKEGDEIKSQVKLKNTEISPYGVRFEGGEISAKIENLAKTETLNLGDYLDAEFSGYNGVGSVEIILNQGKLQEDLQRKFELDKRGCYGLLAEEADTAEEAQKAAADLERSWRGYFRTELSKTENLTNGDTLTLTSTGENEPVYFSGLGIYLEGFSKEMTVENLEEPQDLDLAQALNVEFTGTCPKVRVNVTVANDISYKWDTSLGKMRSCDIMAYNGDVYEGDISYDEETLLRLGYRVINSHFSYKISGLPTAQFTFESLAQESLRPLLEEGYKRAKEAFSENGDTYLHAWNEGDGWVAWDQSGIDFSYAEKDYSTEESPYDRNALFLIYRGEVAIVHWDRSIEKKEVFGASHYSDVVETVEGDLEYYDRRDGFFLSEEELIEWISSRQENLGSGFEKTVLEKEKFEGPPEETEAVEEITVPVQEETAPEYTAPELNGDAASQAAEVISYGGHTYARFEIVGTWETAEEFCERAGGHLAVVTSETEARIIQKLIENGTASQYWLGATDKETEGKWKWVNAEPFVWAHWAGSQPDNDSGNADECENYLTVSRDYDYFWNDAASDAECGFILELDGEGGDEAQLSGLTALKSVGQSETGFQPYVQDPYGKDHYGSLYLNASENGWVSYDLKGGYKALTGNVSTWQEAESGASFEMTVWGDGKLLYELYDYEKTREPVFFSIDVQGVHRLTIDTGNRGDKGGGYLFLNETALLPDETEGEITERRVNLGELWMVDGAHYETVNGPWVDQYGAVHSDGFWFNGGRKSAVLWNLEGSYKDFSGTFVASRDSWTESNAVSVKILADGETVFSAEGFDKYQGYVDFHVDLSGRQTLEIRTSTQEEGDIWINLADTVLTMPVEAKTWEEERGAITFPELPTEILDQAAEELTYGNYRYYRFDQEMSWQEASDFCKRAGGNLACLTTERKQQAAAALSSNGNAEAYWLGGRLTAGKWVWTDGAQLDAGYTNWDYGQPDNYDGKENLLSMYRNGTWNDLDRKTTAGFIMEVQAVSGQMEEGDVRLADLEWIESSHADVADVRDCQGDIHFSSIRLDASNDAWLRCELNGAYSRMDGNITTFSGAAEGVDFQLAIFGDGRLLYELSGYEKDMAAREFSIDLTGVQSLTVVSDNWGSYDYGHLFLNEARMFLAGNGQTEAEIRRLSDLVCVDSVSAETKAGFFVDSFEKFYDRYLELKADSGCKVLYSLDGKYSSFEGTFTTILQTSRSAEMDILISADGETIFEQKGYKKENGPLNFTVDVAGRKTLEITVSDSSGSGNAWIYLTGDRLS